MEAGQRRGRAGMSAALIAAQMVERGDPERFAATMAAPAPLRPMLWPLYAVNLEIARAPWASAEPMVAEMRLQWWVDALEAQAETGAEVPHALGPALVPLRAQAGLLAGIAEARRWDCWRAPFDDEAALWAYLDATSGSLYWAAASAIGADAADEASVRDFGAAAGLASYLRAIPALEERGRVPLPDGRPEAVRALAAEGLARLHRARPARVKPALLPGWQARHILTLAQQDPARVAAGALEPSELRKRLSLMLAAFGRI